MADKDNDEGQGTARAPSLEEAIGELGKAGREGLDAGLDALRALRRLFVADLALARAALARALVWLTVAVAFGSSAWLLVMAAGIALLRHFGLSWLTSISLVALLSLVVTALGAWQALRYFEMSKLDATRRQLARMGIGGDDDDTAVANAEENP
ncbi:MAG: hypothetical protein QM581_12955 [Pseudomonas sp.]